MPGVTIGDGAIIATAAVVTKDVEPFTIVGGNPAAVIRRRFPDDVIAELLRIRWWDWEIDRIEASLTAIEGADIEGLKRG
jgi:virginiamycin A acetyltransferase